MKAQRVCLALLNLVLVSGVGAIGRSRQPNVPDASSPPPASENTHTLSKAKPHAKLRESDRTPQHATDIARSWNGATLFKLEGQIPIGGGAPISGGIEVTCVTCYIKGLVTTEIQYDREFDITQAVTNFTQEIGEGIESIITTAEDYLKVQVPELYKNITNDVDLSDVSLPPLDLSFNIDLPEIPESRLRFRFDDLELYMMLDTVISAGTTYTLNLYSSNTEAGVSLDSETFVGVIASIDLILTADADINIGNGLHIRVDDGMALELSLFGRDVSNVTFNGGSFEFLPVTVQSTSGVLIAKLRVSMHAGVALDLGGTGWVLQASTGAEAVVYADLAEFTTNITAVPEGDDSGCQVRVQQIYQLALGAAAGATLAVGPATWGPDPSTNVPIFYTTLADVCATSVSKTASGSLITATASIPGISARADEDVMMMTTTTLRDEVTFTGLVCLETGLAECPISLRSTTKITSTRTLVTAVPSGSEATFPATTQDAVTETIPFAKNVEIVSATTGSPVSYVPPPPPSSSSPSPGDGPGIGEGGGDDNSGGGGGSGKNLPLIIGLSVGLGVPFLAAVFVSACLLLKRWKYAAVRQSDTVQVASPQEYENDAHTQETKKEKAATATTSLVEPDRRT